MNTYYKGNDSSDQFYDDTEGGLYDEKGHPRGSTYGKEDADGDSDSGADNSRASRNSSRNQSAAEKLRGGEDAAGSTTDSQDSRTLEKSGGIPYTGRSGERQRGFFGKKSSKKEGGVKGFLKKKSSVLVIMLLLGGGGGLGYFSLALGPVHLLENVNQMMDSGLIGDRNARLPKLMRRILKISSSSDADDYVETHGKIKQLFGGEAEVKYGKNVKKLKNSLSKNNFEITELDGGEIKLKYNGEDIDAADFKSKWQTDADFRNDFKKSTTLTSRLSAWTDSINEKFLNKFSLTKSFFKKGDSADQDEDLNDVIKNRQNGDGDNETDLTIAKKEEGEGDGDADADSGSDSDSDSGQKTNTGTDADADTDTETKTKTSTDADADTKTKTSVENTKVKGITDAADSLKNVIGGAANLACGVSGAAVTISAIKVGRMLINSMGGFSKFASVVSGMMAGDLGELYNVLANTFYEPDENGNSMMSSILTSVFSSGGSVTPSDSDASTSFVNLESITTAVGVTIGTTIMCTRAKVGTAIAGIVIDAITIVSAFFTGGLTLLAEKGSELIANVALSTVIGVAANLLVQVAMKGLTSGAATSLCEEFTGDTGGACWVLGGFRYILGNSRSGGGLLMDEDVAYAYHQAELVAIEYEAEYDRATHSPFDVTNQNTFLGSLARSVATPIAKMTTPLGVLGGLISSASTSFASLFPYASAQSNELNYLNTSGKNCGSLSTIGASSWAGVCYSRIGTDTRYADMDPDEVLLENCKMGNFILKDANGNESVSTENTCVDGEHTFSLDSNGNEKIANYSLLAKFINFVLNRESQDGTMDSNIIAGCASADSFLAALNAGDEATGGTVSSFAGAIPIAGDVIDIIDSKNALNCAGWASGANGVLRSDQTQDKLTVANAGNVNIDLSEYTDTLPGDAVASLVSGMSDSILDVMSAVSADEYDIDIIPSEKLAIMQRYVLDDRYNSSISGESAVVAFEERYEAENPTDYSEAGILSRQTGLPKEQIEIALNEEKYWQYIAEYEPNDKYPTPIEDEGFDFTKFLENNSEELEMPAEVVADLKSEPAYRFMRESYVTA